MPTPEYDQILPPPFSEETFVQTVLAHLMLFSLNSAANGFVRRTGLPFANQIRLHRLACGVVGAFDIARAQGVYELYFCNRQWRAVSPKDVLEPLFGDATGLFRLHDLHIRMLPVPAGTPADCLVAAQQLLSPLDAQRWNSRPDQIF